MEKRPLIPLKTLQSKNITLEDYNRIVDYLNHTLGDTGVLEEYTIENSDIVNSEYVFTSDNNSFRIKYDSNTSGIVILNDTSNKIIFKISDEGIYYNNDKYVTSTELNTAVAELITLFNNTVDNFNIQAGTGESALVQKKAESVTSYENEAPGIASAAFGVNTKAKRQGSFTYGNESVSNADNAISGGTWSQANYPNAVAMGDNAVANAYAQAVFGKYNTPSTSDIFIVGDGSYGNPHNAFSIDKDGNAWIGGKTTITHEYQLTPKSYVDNAISNITNYLQINDNDINLTTYQPSMYSKSGSITLYAWGDGISIYTRGSSYASLFLSPSGTITATGHLVKSSDGRYTDFLDNEYVTKSYVDSLKGTANGLATLNENGLIPTSQLPGYVDDVIEYEYFTDLPATGETGKLYVVKATNLVYRWSGTQYSVTSPSIALGETSETAFAGNRGVAVENEVNNIKQNYLPLTGGTLTGNLEILSNSTYGEDYPYKSSQIKLHGATGNSDYVTMIYTNPNGGFNVNVKDSSSNESKSTFSAYTSEVSAWVPLRVVDDIYLGYSDESITITHSTGNNGREINITNEAGDLIADMNSARLNAPKLAENGTLLENKYLQTSTAFSCTQSNYAPSTKILMYNDTMTLSNWLESNVTSSLRGKVNGSSFVKDDILIASADSQLGGTVKSSGTKLSDLVHNGGDAQFNELSFTKLNYTYDNGVESYFFGVQNSTLILSMQTVNVWDWNINIFEPNTGDFVFTSYGEEYVRLGYEGVDAVTLKENGTKLSDKYATKSSVKDWKKILDIDVDLQGNYTFNKFEVSLEYGGLYMIDFTPETTSNVFTFIGKYQGDRIIGPAIFNPDTDGLILPQIIVSNGLAELVIFNHSDLSSFQECNSISLQIYKWA